MFLKGIVLQHFRSYSSAHFSFDKKTTFILGPNTAGKSNLIEALYLLSVGKSFRAEKDAQMISFEKEIARVRGVVERDKEEARDRTTLEVVVTAGMVGGVKAPFKKYLVNNIPKRRVDFAGILSAVLFSPRDLDIIIASPGLRRDFLDSVLELGDYEYRLAKTEYEKGIRQRNALLELAQEAGRRNVKQFEYWDELVIKAGSVVTKKREEFIQFVNLAKKDVLEMEVWYDKSVISQERLEQYKDREVGAGVTLVGPHRDDFVVNMKNKKELVDIKQYGSRGQQRLAIVQLKLLQMLYIEKKYGYRPILLLDDIFSELDDRHIEHILDMVVSQQTIITTTHKEFIRQKKLEDVAIIHLDEKT